MKRALISMLLASCTGYSVQDYLKMHLPEDSLVRQKHETISPFLCITPKKIKTHRQLGQLNNIFAQVAHGSLTGRAYDIVQQNMQRIINKLIPDTIHAQKLEEYEKFRQAVTAIQKGRVARLTNDLLQALYPDNSHNS